MKKGPLSGPGSSRLLVEVDPHLALSVSADEVNLTLPEERSPLSGSQIASLPDLSQAQVTTKHGDFLAPLGLTLEGRDLEAVDLVHDFLFPLALSF